MFSSLLGVISPFLLRDILDTAIPDQNMALLSLLAGGMILISLTTGAIGVVQSYLSTQVGQSVMHDLRTAVYRHLQRLSLAFFTRTRTGEVQSRIANDIGGVDNVLTSTATSVMSTVTTVIATVIAMFLLSWQLALFALGLLPVFVCMTRRVGKQRRAIATVRQESMADMSSLVQESLSVSGILLGKTMGRSTELAERFDYESDRLAGLEVRSRMAGRWMMASIQMTFAIMPAAVYWVGGWTGMTSIGTLVAFTTLQTRLFAPVGSLLSDLRRRAELARALRPRVRVPRPAGRHRGGHAHGRERARRRSPRRRLVPLRQRRMGALRHRHRDPGRHDHGDRGRDGRRARRRSATSSRASTTPRAAR